MKTRQNLKIKVSGCLTLKN